jgi:predicted nucleic acid-binding protein
MGLSTALTDPAARLVADTSTMINLIATGSAADIIAALPNRIAVVDVVPAELEVGRARGREACDRLKELASSGVLEIVELGDYALPYFEQLVVGSAVETVDDGEAATIAYALAHTATALIDERKATRICRERFPRLRVACTIDVLIHDDVRQRLGEPRLADAVFRTLQDAKMGVFAPHLAWVVGLIGEERAALCPSLPRRALAPSGESASRQGTNQAMGSNAR